MKRDPFLFFLTNHLPLSFAVSVKSLLICFLATVVLCLHEVAICAVKSITMKIVSPIICVVPLMMRAVIRRR